MAPDHFETPPDPKKGHTNPKNICEGRAKRGPELLVLYVQTYVSLNLIALLLSICTQPQQAIEDTLNAAMASEGQADS